VNDAVDLNINHLREWVGRTETISDQITSVPIAALSATLDRNDPLPNAGDPLPPLWSWLYFLPLHRHSEIDNDGHAKRGGFLPPVSLPRRMFAGGRFQFHRPLRVGDHISRTSTIADVSYKEGRTGPLVFVAVRHEIQNSEGLAVIEEHDIVYRGDSTGSGGVQKTQTAPSAAAWTREIQPDAVMLFRYSALTFNGHRIHYDRKYATEVEGYPGLVVHGPLIATLLLDLLRRNLPDATVARFAFRAVDPLFDTAPFSVCGRVEQDEKSIRLWASDAAGHLAMDATATLA
jgi:3-methylfumaryl-CoA hydratase